MGSAKHNSNLQQGWLRAPATGQAVVFVHGFTGSASSTWGPEGCSWPELILADETFNGVGIFLSQYETKPTSGEYGFEQASRQVMTQLEVASNGSPKVTDCETILFLGHSAGGIISRHILVRNLRSFRDKKLGLGLLGSPSKGSKLANIADNLLDLPGLGAFTGHLRGRQLLQLTTYSRLLIELNAQFRLLLDYELLHVVGREFIEHRGVIGKTKVVADDSAAVYFGEPVKIAESSHSSLVNPESCQSQMYLEFVRLWRDLLAAPFREGVVTEDIKSEVRNDADLRLFTELQAILGEAPNRWQEWSPGIPYENDWITMLFRFEYRASQADCFFHDPELQAAHAKHYKCAQAFTHAQSQESEPLRDGQSQISKYGKGTRSATHAHKDLYDEALERVEVAHDAWIEAYRDYIKTFKSRLIL